MSEAENLVKAGEDVADVAGFLAMFRMKELAADAIGQVAFDSLRARQIEVNWRLIVAHLTSSAIFQAYGWNLLKQYISPVGGKAPKPIEYAGTKIAFTTLVDMLTARLVGGKINLMNSLINSVGTEGMSFVAGKYLLGDKDSVGPPLTMASATQYS